MKKTFLISLFAIVLVFSCIGLSASITTAQTLDAQGFVNANTTAGQGNATISDFQPLTKVQGTPFESVFGNNATLGGFFQTLFTLSITIGALLAVLMLAWSGYQYLLTDVVTIKGDAKQRIQNALIGLLMLLATVLILRQINPDIVSLRILSNTGTPNIVTGITPGNPTNPGSGTPMTDPYGFCFDTGSGGYHASDYNRYICYNSLPECMQGQNTWSGCRGYSTTSNNSPVTNPNDVGILPSSNEAANYTMKSWFPNEDPGLNTCPLKGPGWVGLPQSMCTGSNTSSRNGQCCGIPKQSVYGAVAEIPNYFWCYNTGNVNAGTKPYHCSVDQATCDADRISYTQTAGQVGLCAQNIRDSGGHSTLIVPSKTYTDYKYASPFDIDTKATGSLNVCVSLFKTTGYVEVPLASCPTSVSFGSTTGKCCAIPSN